MSPKVKAIGAACQASTILLVATLTAGAYGVNASLQHKANILAQAAEISAVKSVVDVAATKDFIWIVLFVAALSISLNFYLVKLLFSTVKEIAAVVVKNTEAMQNVSNVIGDCQLERRRERRYPEDTPR